MSKFRARQLDASKPISIYLQEDITDFTDFNNVTNRTVPQLPTGMEKEEETEHHLQQAIFHQTVIPVPEVYDTTNTPDGFKSFEKLYPSNYKIPRQMIHIHPFSVDQDIPDYDMDSEDDEWLCEHANKGELLPLDVLQFEEMMDQLEKASGLKAVTLQEAKLLLKDDDDLITAVYDYWLNKRLILQHPLIPQVRKILLFSQVRNEKCVGAAPTDPYVAFRKRTEKMQTRKNRKNDEASYEKMLKLKRDLTKAVTLLEMIKRREKSKRELLNLNIEIFEKRNEMDDFSGSIYNEVASQRRQFVHRPVFSPLLSNHQLTSSEVDEADSTHTSWRIKGSNLNRVRRKEEGKRERRAHKRRRKQNQLQLSTSSTTPHHTPPPQYTHPPDPFSITSAFSQDGLTCVGASEEEEEEAASASHSEAEEEANVDGPFSFKRKAFVTYHAPRNNTFVSHEEGGPSFKGGGGDPHHNFSLTSISHPVPKFIGLARRRVGRGGRTWLDRINSQKDSWGINCDIKDTGFKCDINDNGYSVATSGGDSLDIKKLRPHFHPSCGADSSEESEVDVETVSSLPLNEASSKNVSLSGGESALLPSSVFITAEIADGANEGVFTQLRVSLPHAAHAATEDADSCSSSSFDSVGFLEGGENHIEEVDILSTEYIRGENSLSCGKSTQIVTSSQSDLLTSANNVVSSVKAIPNDTSVIGSENSCGATGSATKLTPSVCSNSNNNNHNHFNSNNCLNSVTNVLHHQHHQHSTPLEFQTQPSSRFYTSGEASPVPKQQHFGFNSTGDDLAPSLRCVPSSNNPSLSLHSSSSYSSCNSIVKSDAASFITSSSSCPSSSPLSSLSTTIVSSSIGTSLSNRLLCASNKISELGSSKISDHAANNQETKCKKVNHSSIYLQTNLLSKNANNVLLHNSSLVPPKILSSWTGGGNLHNDDTSTVVMNGPASRGAPLAKQKAPHSANAKVTQIIFPET